MQISELKDKYKGEECFVLGNGPSLNQHDLSKITDRYVFVVNDFHMHPLWPEFKHIFWSEASRISWLFGRFDDWKLQRLLKNKNALYFLRSEFKRINDRTKQFPEDRIYYFNWTNKRRIFDGDYEWDISKEIIFGGSAVITCSMALAQYMGFKRIYIMGCDTTYYYEVDKTFNNAYFYDWRKMPKRYWPRITDVRDLDTAYESWKVIKRLFDERGIEIYNLSRGGKLDIFPYKDYEEVL